MSKLEQSVNLLGSIVTLATAIAAAWIAVASYQFNNWWLLALSLIYLFSVGLLIYLYVGQRRMAVSARYNHYYPQIDLDVKRFNRLIKQNHWGPLTAADYRIKADRLRRTAVSSKHVLYATADAVLDYYAANDWIEREIELAKSQAVNHRNRIIVIKSDEEADPLYHEKLIDIFGKLSKTSVCKIIRDKNLLENEFTFLLKDFGLYMNQDHRLEVTLSFSAYDYLNVFSHNPGGHFIISDQDFAKHLHSQFVTVWDSDKLKGSFDDTELLYKRSYEQQAGSTVTTDVHDRMEATLTK